MRENTTVEIIQHDAELHVQCDQGQHLGNPKVVKKQAMWRALWGWGSGGQVHLWVISRSKPTRFLSLSTIDILSHIILCYEELSCILKNFEQQPSPLLTRCWQLPSPRCDNQTVSRHCQTFLRAGGGGSKITPVKNHSSLA